LIKIKNIVTAIENSQQDNLLFHVKNILVQLPEAPTPDQVQAASEKAQNILQTLHGDSQFSTTAIAQSGAQNALKGGDMGWHTLAELPDIYAAQLKQMKPGDISEPLQTANGFHIIKYVGKRQGKSKKHFITKTHVRHILIKTDAITNAKDVKLQLKNIRTQLEKGEKFATIAEQSSQDPGSANKGGDLGWVVPGELTPTFETAMNKLKLHTVSQPIQTQFGWHLIEVLARKKVDDSKNFERSRAKKILYQRKYEEQLQSWLQRLRDKTYVNIKTA